LVLLRDVGDSELDYIYGHAAALVIPSLAEGFGLPVVEAFQRGLPVMCSDIPVFREVADGRASFFSLGSPQALADELARFDAANPPGQPLPRLPIPWPNWRESTEDCFAAMQRLLRPQQR
jgi:alpha-1,2-rhamnosyltransferase